MHDKRTCSGPENIVKEKNILKQLMPSTGEIDERLVGPTGATRAYHQQTVLVEKMNQT